jgi:hypothetical protein
MHCHPSFETPTSTRQAGFALKRRLQIGGAGLTVWRVGRRNRAGAGAGATPVFVAQSRHESLPRSPGLVRGSLPHLPSEFLLVNRNAILGQANLISKE